MGNETDIKLARSYKPKFPDRCISCGASRPNDVLAFFAGYFDEFHVRPMSRRFAVEAPVCAGCRGDLQTRRWIIRVAIWLTLLLQVIFVIWAMMTFDRIWVKLFGIVGVLVCMLPYACAQWLFRLPIALETSSTQVTYKIHDPAYRIEFAQLNGLMPSDNLDRLRIE